MKRYMLSAYQIDSRPTMLEDPPEHWDPIAREAALVRKRSVLQEIDHEYGMEEREQKTQNFKDVGPFPQSILSYHNPFLVEVRRAFVAGGYYPALTGAASLGERLLNHMVISLHSLHGKSSKYRKARSICAAGGCTDWSVLIDILADWDILLPASSTHGVAYVAVADQFRELKELRNLAVHYNGGVIEADVRGAALGAITTLQSIILRQFGFFAFQPWFMRDTPGAQFVQKSWEHNSFVATYYLPNCLRVGPYYRIERIQDELTVVDDHPYQAIEISDDEFRDAFVTSRHG